MDSAEKTSYCSRVEIETAEQRERERECRALESEEMREDRLLKRRAGDRARRASESAEMGSSLVQKKSKCSVSMQDWLQKYLNKGMPACRG